jgi:hypothetical protein
MEVEECRDKPISMNIKKLLLLICILFTLKFEVNAQTVPFEKIEYASFDINSPRVKQKNELRINLYSKIDQKGLITILDDDDYHHTLTFHTYQLNPANLQKIASVINGKNPLRNYMVKQELDTNSFYGGSYEFISVTYKNKTKDSLCFIESDMSDEFDYVYKMLGDIYYGKRKLKKINPFTISKYFRNAVLSSYKKSSYLPKIQFPPSFRLEDQKSSL